MESIDIIDMLGNLGKSMGSIQMLVSGLAYLIAIMFFWVAIGKFRQIGDARAMSPSQVRMFVPVAYLLAGTALLFLPSTVEVIRNTTFGADNVLQYQDYNKYDVKNVTSWFVRTAGLIWFVRGCVLMAHASNPGVQEGPKGLAFVIAGILAMNFEHTAGYIDHALNQLMSTGLAIKESSGY